MENTKGCAVIVEDMGLSSRLNTLPVTKDMAWDTQTECPACATALETCATLADHDRSQVVRYGLCPTCGYMGYIDRPTERWFIDFYSKDWDKEFIRPREQMRKDADDLLQGRGKASRPLAVALLEKVRADKERYICDIGSGYGQVLRFFQHAGFRKIIGVENSRHRSELVKEVFGLEVLHGGFQEESVQKSLRAIAPIGTFFSHHVFEHTYHPADVIKKVSELQKEGDHLIFALPNAEGEHVNFALLYLVHLHAFTKESLEVLFNRHGYEIVADASPDPTNIIVAARKVTHPQARYATGRDYRKEFVARFKKGFRIGEIADEEPYAIYWQQKTEEADTSSLEVHLPSPALTRAWWHARKTVDFLKSRYLKRLTGGDRMLLRNPGKDTTTDGPCEIRFKKEILFLIK